MRTVSAADANRYFSALLRDVRTGESISITSRGEPVARLVPLSEGERAVIKEREAAKQLAWERHLAGLRSQPAMNIPITWTRDELYDDDV